MFGEPSENFSSVRALTFASFRALYMIIVFANLKIIFATQNSTKCDAQPRQEKKSWFSLRTLENVDPVKNRREFAKASDSA
jgi:hypothetical protein